jgi:hypothetical protein
MKRILFVDDDLPTLEGLRVRLSQMEHKWTAAPFDRSEAARLAAASRESEAVRW